MKAFCNRYDVSDLIPAVEVVGVADWYEDLLADISKRLENIDKLIEEQCAPTVL